MNRNLKWMLTLSAVVVMTMANKVTADETPRPAAPTLEDVTDAGALHYIFVSEKNANDAVVPPAPEETATKKSALDLLLLDDVVDVTWSNRRVVVVIANDVGLKNVANVVFDNTDCPTNSGFEQFPIPLAKVPPRFARVIQAATTLTTRDRHPVVPKSWKAKFSHWALSNDGGRVGTNIDVTLHQPADNKVSLR